MDDNRIDVLERLTAADPHRPAAEYDQAHADRLLAAILAEPRPAYPRIRKRLVAAAVAIIVVGIAAPALAFSDSVRTFVGLRNPPVLEESTLLVSAPVADGTVARLWRGRTTSGGVCFFETYGPPGDVEHPREVSGGSCSDRPLPPSVHVGIGKKPRRPYGAAEWVPPVISGHLDPKLGATRVEVQWTGGSKELAYADGHFIGAVEALYEAPAALLPIRLVAFDAQGRVVHERDISAPWSRLD